MMSRTLVRRMALVFFAVYLLAMIWPVAGWMGAPEPFLFGLPLSMAWPILWIVLGWIVLLVVDRLDAGRNHRRQRSLDPD